MTIYTVHVPPGRRLRAGPDPARAVFVKEGFCWPGFVLALPWLLVRGIWIAAAFYIIALAGAAYLADQETLFWLPAIGVVAFLQLLIGFEGNDLRRWSLGLRGYELSGVVEAASRDEAEIRFFAAPGDPPPLPAVAATPPLERVTLLPPPQPEVVGLFPNPGSAP